MHTARETKNSRLKLAQLWHMVSSYKFAKNKILHNRAVDVLLKDDFNINCKVTIQPDSLAKYQTPLEDFTALHFLYRDVYDFRTFDKLVKRGADFTVKNGIGQTVLHMIADKYYSTNSNRDLPFINSVLSAQVELQNSINPHDDTGLSHLHVACIANHIQAVELFLNNGEFIDEAVNLDGARFAGYTPLHFAVKFGSFAVAQLLVSRGANINAKNVQDIRPLDLLIENHQMYGISEEDISEKEKMMKLLLENCGVSGTGISNFQVACALKDLSVAERLLDQGADIDYTVPVESPVCPGYTALHFALNNSIEAVKILLKRGAKIDVANAEGRTPLDVCADKYSMRDLSDILSCNKNFNGLCLSDGKSKLLDLISAMENFDNFKSFLRDENKDIDSAVPLDSMLWSGYTILHLAVTCMKKVDECEKYKKQGNASIVRECLTQGVNINIQDAKGRTPVHLAFILGKLDIVKLLLDRLDELDPLLNLVDQDNLSYLHIACQMGYKPLIEKLLKVSDPNISYKGKTLSGVIITGITPLHIAAVYGSQIIVDMLLRHGADMHATDINGWTAIHWLTSDLESLDDRQQMVDCLLGSLQVNPEDHVVDGLGLSYLHVACFFGALELVEKLLNIGSNVNQIIDSKAYFVDRFCGLPFIENYSPLHMAVKAMDGVSAELVDLLLRHGADPLVIGFEHEPRFLIEDETVLPCFLQILWNRKDMQKRMEERLGLTKLHIACYMKNEEAIRSALKVNIDINAQLHADSVISAGCTPLHLLMTAKYMQEFNNFNYLEFTLGDMMKLLLDQGADVTIANAERDTPIHAFRKHQRIYVEDDYCEDLLLNAQRNFNVNPINAEGLSHFHVACSWHKPEIVEKFLQHGSVDVNQAIDYFAKYDAGSTPLHLALDTKIGPDKDWAKLNQVVDLLLKYGADVSAKDVHGDTPLHKPAILRSPGLSTFVTLLSYGANVTMENIQGQTPFEQWSNNNKKNILCPSNYIKILKKCGYKINSCNRHTGEGYIGKIFLSDQNNLSDNSEFEEFLKSSDVRTIDASGRTAIHNLVAILTDMCTGKIDNYMYAIDSFTKIGIDIDHQDKSGQTALHCAMQMNNMTGVEALLKCGADVNIVDNDGNSAFLHAIKHQRNLSGIIIDFRWHLEKLQYLQVGTYQNHLEKIDHYFQTNIDNTFSDINFNYKNFFSQIEVTKTMDIGTHSLKVFDLLSDTGAVNLYCLMPKIKRDLVDDFFKSIDLKKLNELAGIMKYQLRKMKSRLGFIDSALCSLKILLGFSVPDLCEQISIFLSNSDLKNLIDSTSMKGNKRKFLEITI